MEAQEQTRFDRAPLKAFGDLSINFEAVYHVKVPEYAAYMDGRGSSRWRPGAS